MALLRKRPTTANTANIRTLIQTLIPLNSLDPDRQEDLIKHAILKTYPSGAKLFNQGDMVENTIYLVDGEIELSDNSEQTTLTAGSENARLAIDPNDPRKYNAVCKTAVQTIEIDKNLVDVLLTWDPYAGYVVDEIDSSESVDYDDWMLAMLQSEIFQRIPPATIQSMFQKFEPVVTEKDEVIFSQGSTGDYFYIIQSGECSVTRLTGNNSQVIATLGKGACFGEDALLSNKPRNATISMLSEGRLLRLSKEDFDDLFRSNVVTSISAHEAALLVVESGAIYIDVRQPEEFNSQSIPGSINIPLPLVRDSLDKIPSDKPCIVYCDSGQRSICAAYLLCANSREAYALENGMQSLSGAPDPG